MNSGGAILSPKQTVMGMTHRFPLTISSIGRRLWQSEDAEKPLRPVASAGENATRFARADIKTDPGYAIQNYDGTDADRTSSRMVGPPGERGDCRGADTRLSHGPILGFGAIC